MAENGDFDRVAEIRQRLEAATPGEWRHCSGMVRSTGRALDMPTEQHSVAAFANGAEIGHKVAITDGAANSALIAAAPDDLAWLLSRLAVVEAERDELRAKVAKVRGWHDGGDDGLCGTCGYAWPCGTSRALSGTTEGPS